MGLGHIADIASILGAIISVISLIVSTSVLIRVRKIQIDDSSQKGSQIAKGIKNQQSIIQQ